MLEKCWLCLTSPAGINCTDKPNAVCVSGRQRLILYHVFQISTISVTVHCIFYMSLLSDIGAVMQY